MTYTHDMMHCSQRQCTKRDTCYRYWLGTQLSKSGFRYASFYYPQSNANIGDACPHYIKNY